MQINEILEDVKVTIVCITYNHESIIRDALDSFLRQKTSFKYQIFVGEDKGPDGTAEVVKEYAEKYPDKIVAFLREENMGAQRNLIDLCNHAKSPYIAFCEGDDYWIDDHKLQKQYDYMEEHSEIRICFARARISAPDDWFLRSYFKENRAGELVYPECDPLCPKTKKKGVTTFTNKDFTDMFIAHTSTIFYRYNYDVVIPEWYYDGIVGDMSLFLMQLGDGKCAMLPDIVSVYRRSDVGVYMSRSIDEHFLKSRMDWIRIMKGMIEFYEENDIKEFPKQGMIARIRKEISNYVSTAVNCGRIDRVAELIMKYPEQCRDMFTLYPQYYYQNQRMIGAYSWEGKVLLTQNRYFINMFRPLMLVISYCYKIIRTIKCHIKNAAIYLLKWAFYWGYSMIPKKKNLWVFSGFRKDTYMDNSKYFFEYVLDHYPQIEAVWLTKSDEILSQLRDKGMPVYKMNSWKGICVMAKAAIAVIDHFVMSDLSAIYGYNHKTKVVQLWHGVGFKSMGDGKEVHNTTVPGVQYSTDLFPQEGDSILNKVRKRIKYFFCAPVRELFEEYFLFLCPGQWQRDMIGHMWNVQEESFCYAGYPRNYAAYSKMGQVEKKRKVLYAPTYRFSYEKERELIEGCLDQLPKIQKKMEKLEAEFVLRLHPHTWRNYESIIYEKIQEYSRVTLDCNKDFYSSVLEYSVIITDYSSVGIDANAFDIPSIYYCPDYEWYIKHDAGISIDYENMTPGPKARTWEDALHEVEEYFKNPSYRREKDREISSYYLDRALNNIDNSKVIADEIIMRLERRK